MKSLSLVVVFSYARGFSWDHGLGSFITSREIITAEFVELLPWSKAYYPILFIRLGKRAVKKFQSSLFIVHLLYFSACSIFIRSTGWALLRRSSLAFLLLIYILILFFSSFRKSAARLRPFSPLTVLKKLCRASFKPRFFYQ